VRHGARPPAGSRPPQLVAQRKGRRPRGKRPPAAAVAPSDRTPAVTPAVGRTRAAAGAPAFRKRTRAPGGRPGRRRLRWPLAGLLLAAFVGLLLAAMLARSPGGAAAGGSKASGPTANGPTASGPQAVGTKANGPTASGPQAVGTAASGTTAGRTAARGGTGTGTGTTEEAGAVAAAGVERLKVKVLSVWPHDPGAYTQGLVWDRGTLYESAGLYGSSSLRQVDPATGEVRRRRELPPGFFAEGLAKVGERLVQLTWKEGVAFIYDLRSFERVGEHRYEGEGWGLCNDGHRLVMSDGSDQLSFRDLVSFALLGRVDVRLDGRPAQQLNELECVDGAVYANVWTTDEILRIDPASGRVTGVVDAGGLLGADELSHADVLNGIAYDSVKKTFLITGKLWPKMFEVVFVPAGASPRG
jgi:glutamine cyclotransferase